MNVHGRRLRHLETLSRSHRVTLEQDIDTMERLIMRVENEEHERRRQEFAFHFRNAFDRQLKGVLHQPVSETIRKDGISLYEEVPGASIRSELMWLAVPERVKKLCEEARPLFRSVQTLMEIGALHRDIHPGNIVNGVLVDSTYLAFVGRANREVEWSPGVTHGTPEYMSPEVVASKWEPSSDIFSLGVTFADYLLAYQPEQPRQIMKDRFSFGFMGAPDGQRLHALRQPINLAIRLNEREPSEELITKVHQAIELITRLTKMVPEARPKSEAEAFDGLDVF